MNLSWKNERPFGDADIFWPTAQEVTLRSQRFVHYFLIETVGVAILRLRPRRSGQTSEVYSAFHPALRSRGACGQRRGNGQSLHEGVVFFRKLHDLLVNVQLQAILSQREARRPKFPFRIDRQTGPGLADAIELNDEWAGRRCALIDETGAHAQDGGMTVIRACHGHFGVDVHIQRSQIGQEYRRNIVFVQQQG